MFPGSSWREAEGGRETIITWRCQYQATVGFCERMIRRARRHVRIVPASSLRENGGWSCCFPCPRHFSRTWGHDHPKTSVYYELLNEFCCSCCCGHERVNPLETGSRLPTNKYCPAFRRKSGTPVLLNRLSSHSSRRSLIADPASSPSECWKTLGHPKKSEGTCVLFFFIPYMPMCTKKKVYIYIPV